ncbi:MAG: lysine-2,3-aminomutase-like protein [Rhodospirillaceae bacterium]|nr:lysine-2,3-aminomutase-like protein [Rhodospirillaceae bacterium]
MNAPAASTLRTPEQLAVAGLLAPGQVAGLSEVAARYAVAITPTVADIIRAGGSDGPVARQYLPDARELDVRPDEATDPIGDAAHAPVKGIVHRYPDRVLLMPTQVCAVYCRFCFRRENVGPQAGALTDGELDAALDYIRRTPAVWEVILTGGDPLVLSPRRLARIIGGLEQIPHVAVIRIHSRVPVAAPERITPALLDALRATAKPVYVGVHCNHADELSTPVRAGLTRLRQAGIGLVSQSVLLRGVSDSVAALEDLFRGLLTCGVKPYYLHQLDRAPGTARFRVPLDQGQALMKALRGRVSGLALPTYVLDIPGGAGKVPVGPTFMHRDATGRATAEDRDGRSHPVDDAPGEHAA